MNSNIEGQILPTARLSARQWPPKFHKVPVTFNLGKETVGLLKSIDVKLVNFYERMFKNSQEKARNNEFHWVCENVKTFDLSFYVPQDVMGMVHRKIKNVLIMVNGLNEISHIHYTHYDRIGTSLSRNGMGGILFPGPFHLNRTAYLEERFKEDYERRPEKGQKWPRSPGAPTMNRIPHKSMLRHPEALFYSFLQVSSEIRSFARHLRRLDSSLVDTSDDFINTDSIDEMFYDQLFDRSNISINLLGYSLGGLQALYTFLRKPDIFDHCILVNSGASIDNLRTKPVRISDEDWKEIKQTAHAIRYDLPEDISRVDRNLLNEVLFERPFKDEETAKIFSENAHKIFFIAGGADIVSPAEHLLQFLKKNDHNKPTSEFRGLNILQVEGLAHPLQRSLDYDRWFPVIISTIDKFLRSPDPKKEKQVSFQDVMDWFLQLKVGDKAWADWCRAEHLLDADGDHNLDVSSIIKEIGEEKLEVFLRYYVISKRYFENDAELLRNLERQKK